VAISRSERPRAVNALTTGHKIDEAGRLHFVESSKMTIWPVRCSRRVNIVCQRSIIVALLSVLQVGGASDCAAQISDVEVQGPWAYSHQFDEAHHVEFLATTRAEDMDVFLVLACSSARVAISFIHLNRFPYVLRERGHVTMRLDQSDPISIPVALIGQNNLSTDPRSIKDLVSMLMRSNRLSVAITETDGAVHTYVFALQPNDVALDHCQ